VNRRVALKLIGGAFAGTSLGSLAYFGIRRDDWLEKRVKVVATGQLVRGAWQRPGPLRRIIAREGIRTIVTLTAISAMDPKFRDQQRVVEETGIGWVIIPMRGSRGTPEQMALAADMLADPARQPVFFHCVAGHHRTSLAHAAYLIRHRGYTPEHAWDEVANLSWSRPDSPADRNDRFLIEEFARIQRSLAPVRENGIWEIVHGASSEPTSKIDRTDLGSIARGPLRLDRLEPGDV
jgi:protein tyrosine phosphatase (PTP) superfamily phosphohydrolase (DUF442 family)